MFRLRLARKGFFAVEVRDACISERQSRCQAYSASPTSKSLDHPPPHVTHNPRIRHSSSFRQIGKVVLHLAMRRVACQSSHRIFSHLLSSPRTSSVVHVPQVAFPRDRLGPTWWQFLLRLIGMPFLRLCSSLSDEECFCRAYIVHLGTSR